MERTDAALHFRYPPELHTPRLILRKMEKSDAADMYEYACDETVTKYLLWEPHVNERFTLRYLSYIQSRYRAGEFYDWAIIEKSKNKMIGTCGFTSFDFPNNSAEVGYVLNPRFWHCGIAAEALFEVIRFGFNTLNLNRIEAKYMVDNVNSLRVMEKVGMTFEGISRKSMFVKGKYVSIGVCSILKSEFEGFESVL